MATAPGPTGAGRLGPLVEPLLMALRRFVAFLAVALVASMTPATAQIDPPAKLDRGLIGRDDVRAIVMFDHNVSDSTVDRLARAGITHARIYPAIDTVAVLGPAASYLEIATWPDVTAVDRDSKVRYFNEVAKQDTKVTKVRSGAKPLSTKYDGEGVTVAVVDSGVDTTHPDLQGRFAANVDMEYQPILDDITDGEYSKSNAERPASTDEFGHGTHVAGTVGGTGASGQGADLSGVAPGSTLINCKIGLSTAFETSALACFQWLLDHRNDERFPGGIRVATNSWGLSPGDSQGLPLEAMIREMTRKGIVVLFAAGNNGPMKDGKSTVSEYPNRMEEVITVGATCKSSGFTPESCDGKLAVANFSSQGPEVDVSAPGADIWSTKAAVSALTAITLTSTAPPPGASPPEQAANRALYTSMSGTSMSTPHVAGVVALILDADPALTPAQVEKILIRTSTDMGDKGFDVAYGHGFVNALKAVDLVESQR